MSKAKTGFSPQALLQVLPSLPKGTRLWVAYSGGCDSLVLLHALAQLRDCVSCELHAVHVHHGLSVNADQWVQHCQQVTYDLGIPFTCLKVDATPQGKESPEEAARRARYQAIIELLNEGDYLCTAHHQDDQAETLLIQLLRGAGPKGLAAMPSASPLGKATQLRPLLNFSRDQLCSYAEQHELVWVDDESNNDTGFSRNYLRHSVMPILKQRWPSVEATLARSARNCAEAAELIEVLAKQDLQVVQTENSNEVDIDHLKSLDNARLKNVLRYWISSSGYPLPSDKKLQHVLSDVLGAAGDKTPLVAWPGAEVRRFQGRLYLLPPLPESDTTQIIQWCDVSQPLA